MCCGALARYYSGQQDSLVQSDSVDYKSKGGEFSRRAKELLQLYQNFLGQDEKGKVSAAGGVTEWDVDYPWGGDRLTHPRRER